MSRYVTGMREDLDDLEDKSWKRKSYALAQHNALPIPMPHPVYPPPTVCPPPAVIRPSRHRGRPPNTGYRHPASYHPVLQRPSQPDRLAPVSESTTLDQPLRRAPSPPRNPNVANHNTCYSPQELNTFRNQPPGVRSQIPTSMYHSNTAPASMPMQNDANTLIPRPSSIPVPMPRSPERIPASSRPFQNPPVPKSEFQTLVTHVDKIPASSMPLQAPPAPKNHMQSFLPPSANSQDFNDQVPTPTRPSIPPLPKNQIHNVVPSSIPPQDFEDHVPASTGPPNIPPLPRNQIHTLNPPSVVPQDSIPPPSIPPLPKTKTQTFTPPSAAPQDSPPQQVHPTFSTFNPQLPPGPAPPPYHPQPTFSSFQPPPPTTNVPKTSPTLPAEPMKAEQTVSPSPQAQKVPHKRAPVSPRPRVPPPTVPPPKPQDITNEIRESLPKTLESNANRPKPLPRHCESADKPVIPSKPAIPKVGDIGTTLPSSPALETDAEDKRIISPDLSVGKDIEEPQIRRVSDINAFPVELKSPSKSIETAEPDPQISSITKNPSSDFNPPKEDSDSMLQIPPTSQSMQEKPTSPLGIGSIDDSNSMPEIANVPESITPEKQSTSLPDNKMQSDSPAPQNVPPTPITERDSNAMPETSKVYETIPNTSNDSIEAYATSPIEQTLPVTPLDKDLNSTPEIPKYTSTTPEPEKIKTQASTPTPQNLNLTPTMDKDLNSTPEIPQYTSTTPEPEKIKSQASTPTPQNLPLTPTSDKDLNSTSEIPKYISTTPEPDKTESQTSSQNLPLTPSTQSRSSSLASIGCRTPTSIRAAPSWQPMFPATPLSRRATPISRGSISTNSETSLTPSTPQSPEPTPRPETPPEECQKEDLVGQNVLPTPPSSPSQTREDSVTPASSLSSLPHGRVDAPNGKEKRQSDPDEKSVNLSISTQGDTIITNIKALSSSDKALAMGNSLPSIASFGGEGGVDLKHSPTSSESFQTYKARFWILTVFSFICFLQTIVWGTFGPIAESAQAAFPTWDDTTIAAFPNWGPIIVVVFIFPMVWLSQKLGLQAAMIVCELFLTLGTMIRCFTSQEAVFTVMCHVSSVLFAFAACFTLSLPAMLAATWFPPNERITATAVGTLMCQLGGAAMYLGALMVRYPSTDKASLTDIEREDIRGDIMVLMYIHFGAALLLLLAVAIYFPGKPPTPPSASSTEERIDYFKAIRMMFKNVQMALVLIVFAFSFGVPVVWIAVLNLSLKDIGINQDKAMGVAVTAVVCSSVTAFIAARITDRVYGHLKITVIILLAVSSVFFLWFLLLTTQVITPTLGQVYVAVAGGLCFEYATVPLLVELAVEIGFPIPESVTGATLTFVFNLVSLVFLGLFQIPTEGHLWVSCVLLACVSLSIIPLIFVKETHKRSDTDRKFM